MRKREKCRNIQNLRLIGTSDLIDFGLALQKQEGWPLNVGNCILSCSLLESVRCLHGANRITTSDVFCCIHVTLEEVYVCILFG